MSLRDASATAASVLVDLGHGEPDVDEHPVTGREDLVLQQADVDHSAHASHVDAGELVVVRIQLDQLTGDPEAHERLLAWWADDHIRRRRR